MSVRPCFACQVPKVVNRRCFLLFDQTFVSEHGQIGIVQKGLVGGKDQLDFQLNPRNLGKMQISLVMQNDRTNIHIQTETSAAASMLSDSEARLSQMLEASGLRLGNLNSGQSQGFSGNMSGGHAKQQNRAETSGNADASESKDQSLTTEQSENLINIQA